MTLDELNRLPSAEAHAAFERCCGTRAWVDRMCASRPFADGNALLEAAERAWWSLAPAEWRQAFAHHPRIGDVEALRKRFAATATWASDEQKGAAAASEAALAALAEGNRRYEETFGHIFIVCATGKSADAMLAMLERRLPNDPETEIRVAAEEQMKITRLRLEKLLTEVS